MPTYDTDVAQQLYTDIMARSDMATGITRLAKNLKSIFEADREEAVYRQSGKLVTDRLQRSSLTARVFEKKIQPGEKFDTAVFVLVDESGSMRGGKSVAAKLCVIGLAEAFEKVHIPLYVMGFTDANYGNKAVHRHYITWNNSRKNRQKLLQIEGRQGNFDGYAIRTATEIIKKKQAVHKLLIVISDGEPASEFYPNWEDGIMDTKMAVQEGNRIAPVVGVLIGSENPTQHREMYGANFLHCSNPNDMFKGIAKAIEKQIRSW